MTAAGAARRLEHVLARRKGGGPAQHRFALRRHGPSSLTGRVERDQAGAMDLVDIIEMAGYQPTTDMGALQGRITTITKGSVIPLQAIHVPADDLSQFDLPGSEGDPRVLAGDAPLVTVLRPGIIVVFRDGGDLRVGVKGSFGRKCAGRPRGSCSFLSG
jgi:hypothetical protein